MLEVQANSSEEWHASLFISYSREDKDLVRRLDQALAKRERDTWVDLENIRPTEAWLAGVYAGIEGADDFVFVISPDSVKSRSCLQELNHAVEHNKRLVPIMHREVDASAVPEPLRFSQWIFFRNEDDFEKALQDLVDALDTDLDWVRAHTRLLTRAIEWAQNGRDSSFVLRGSDLRTAEEWQVRAADEEPKLTALQTEYILAGRGAATRRQRTTLGAVTLGLVIAIILGGLAWLARNEAERQANIALSRQLAAQSELVRSQEGSLLQRSALLAVESMRRFPSVDADQALRGVLTLLPRPISTLVHDSEVEDVVFSSDGRYLATASADAARVWEASIGKEVARMEHDDVSIVAFGPDENYLATAGGNATAVWEVSTGRLLAKIEHEGGVYDVAFSPDGKYLASVGGDSVRVWDAKIGREVASVARDAGASMATFSPDGRYLATSGESYALPAGNIVQVWQPVGGREVARIEQEDIGVNAIGFSTDGRYLATASTSSQASPKTTARIWDASSGKAITSIEHQEEVTDLAFSPDDNLATASWDKTARIWETSTGQELVRMAHDSFVDKAAFSSDGRYLATSSLDKTARVWEASGGDEIVRIVRDGSEYDTDMAFSSDGRQLATIGRHNTVWVWEARNAGDVARMVHSGVQEMTFGPHGKYVATASWDKGTARVWEASSGKEVARMNHGSEIKTGSRYPDAVTDIAFDPDGKYVATASNDGTARVWETSSGKEVARMNHGDTVNALAFSPDGKYLATASGYDMYSPDKAARLWEVTTGRQLVRMEHEDIVVDVAFNPDGKYLATASGDAVRVWEASNGKEATHVNHDGHVGQVAFSPDGEYLATAGEDNVRVLEGTTGMEVARMAEGGGSTVTFDRDAEYLASSGGRAVRVWVASSGEETVSIKHEGVVTDVAFDPTGEYLATASNDTTARVWEVSSGREVARIDHGGAVTDVEYGPRGRYLVTTSSDGSARVSYWHPKDLIEVACARLTRNLAQEEWQQYLGDERYRKTCSSVPANYGAEEYVTDEFEPAFRIEIGEGWKFLAPETTGELLIETSEGGQLIFTNPLQVFDPSNLSEPRGLPEPDDVAEWASWLQRHPNLHTSDPVPVNVGGVSGKQMDVMYASAPENYPQDLCGEEPCVPLYRGSTKESMSVSYDGWKDRLIILEVGGETVLIDAAAPAHEFDTFFPEAQEVLDTVEWNEG